MLTLTLESKSLSLKTVLIFILFLMLFLCLYGVLPARMSVNLTTCMSDHACPQIPEEGIKFPGTGVT